MSSEAQQDERLDEIEDFDIDGWERVDGAGDTVTLLSDDRRDKITVKAVSVQNDQFDYAYLIEFFRGETAYAGHRSQKANKMAPTASQVPVTIRELIQQYS